MRRRITSHPTDAAEAARKFHLGDSDDFARSWFGDPLFPTEAEAARTWQAPGVRPLVWARAHRMTIPHPARVFDKLMTTGWDVLWHTWNAEVFALDAALAALAADRAAVVRFERRDRRGARDVAACLTLWRADLDTLETIARELGGWTGPPWQRPCPSHRMSSAVRYGGRSDR